FFCNMLLAARSATSSMRNSAPTHRLRFMLPSFSGLRHGYAAHFTTRWSFLTSRIVSHIVAVIQAVIQERTWVFQHKDTKTQRKAASNVRVEARRRTDGTKTGRPEDAGAVRTCAAADDDRCRTAGREEWRIADLW